MLQQGSDVISRLYRYDPGAMRLVRGIHMMLTIVVAAAAGEQLSHFTSEESGLQLAVLAAAAGAFCMLFTPVSTRQQEARVLLLNGIVTTALFGAGALLGVLGGKSAGTLLQVLWIGVVALGFGLFGVNPFWQRAGRMISITWLFVYIANLSNPAGFWLPTMAALGVAIAMIVRLGLWRPSPEATFRQLERATRRAMADHFRRVTDSGFPDELAVRKSISGILDLRVELGISAALAARGGEVKGLVPETATMMQLALEVVNDALTQMSAECRAKLAADAGYRNSVRHLALRIEDAGSEDRAPLEADWMQPGKDVQIDDRFHTFRLAQSFRRLLQLSRQGGTLPAARAPAAVRSAEGWWHRISWILALQAAVAAAVGIAFGSAFGLSHAYWITLTVVVVLCNNLGNTLRKSFQRTLGTAAGVLAAVVIDPLLSEFPVVRLALAVLAIPAFVIFIDRNYTIAAGFVTFLIVIGLQTLEHVPIVELWWRLYDTAIGAGVGLAVAWVLFPRRMDVSVKSLTASYLASCAAYLKDTSGEVNADYIKLRQAAANLVTEARAYRAEQAPWSSILAVSSALDTVVFVLADYAVLYRQARASVLSASQGQVLDRDIVALVERLDARIQNEFETVRQGGKQTEPGLAEDWPAAMPQVAEADTRLLTDWVAAFYYARKLLRCLDGLRRGELLSSPVPQAPSSVKVSA
ncbi:hypothetical protein MesoLjLc_31190 [Mesorhizobium sp. L-8-10]|uniref:FUSC family protein n=1 Tax=Mesorhizobium sp. L-8-10 TaxID=2744523 RepID=UPI0019288B8F|nr:FUSC family protein [Mesorhizobium sp. L-8-10]BCH31189.1 hypothetical protein MesoLjLc_31190 [Mesorhizobium sp. L-8-10]